MSTPQTQWYDLQLCRPLLRAVADLGFEKPTPIQAQAIPVILSGSDVLATAITGSGKTLAFLLPILQRLILGGQKTTAQAVILSPTRELAMQTFSVFEKVSQHTSITGAQLTGGLSVQQQEATLRALPNLIVATPGRLLDHLFNSRGFDLNACQILVLDEADKLLAMGFERELTEIIGRSPGTRQTLLFSATLTPDVQALSKLSLRSPVSVAPTVSGTVAAELVQEFVRLPANAKETEKMAILMALVTRDCDSDTLVFFPTKRMLRRAAAALQAFDVQHGQLHGDLTQPQRLTMLEAFRAKNVPLLLCSDVASRGLDLPFVRRVINIGVPRNIDDYIHRVGRTARAGRAGAAITIVTEDERLKLKHVVRGSSGRVVARTIDPEARRLWVKRLEDSAATIQQIEESARDDLRIAELQRDLDRAQNLIEHRDEIAARPRRVWKLRSPAEEEREKKRQEKADLKTKIASLQPTAKGNRDRQMLLRAHTAKRLEQQYRDGLLSRNQFMKARSDHGLVDTVHERSERRKKRREQVAARAAARAAPAEKSEADLMYDMARRMKAEKKIHVKRATKAFHSKRQYKRR